MSGIQSKVARQVKEQKSTTHNNKKNQGPVIKTLCFHCGGCGFDPWLGIKISHASQCGQIKRKKKKKRIRKINQPKLIHSKTVLHCFIIVTVAITVFHMFSKLEERLNMLTRDMEDRKMTQFELFNDT